MAVNLPIKGIYSLRKRSSCCKVGNTSNGRKSLNQPRMRSWGICNCSSCITSLIFIQNGRPIFKSAIYVYCYIIELVYLRSKKDIAADIHKEFRSILRKLFLKSRDTKAIPNEIIIANSIWPI